MTTVEIYFQSSRPDLVSRIIAYHLRLPSSPVDVVGPYFWVDGGDHEQFSSVIPPINRNDSDWHCWSVYERSGTPEYLEALKVFSKVAHLIDQAYEGNTTTCGHYWSIGRGADIDFDPWAEDRTEQDIEIEGAIKFECDQLANLNERHHALESQVDELSAALCGGLRSALRGFWVGYRGISITTKAKPSSS